MKYLSTLFLIVAVGGLVVGFSISLRHNEQMLDEARVATLKSRQTALAKKRRRMRSFHAGVVAVPAEPAPVVESPER